MNANRPRLIQWAAALFCAAFTLTTASAFAQQATGRLTEEEAHQLGIEAVVYGFPLVIVDVTKQVQTNVAEPEEGGHAPVNQFSNFLKYPTAAYKDVVRMNGMGVVWLARDEAGDLADRTTFVRTNLFFPLNPTPLYPHDYLTNFSRPTRWRLP